PCPAPTLSCLPDKTVQCGAPWFFDPPSVLTNGCGTNYALRAIAYTNKYACMRATITWILTDCCSNEVYCSQSVTINDFNPPNVTCPANKTVECGTAWNFDTPTAVDDCCGTNVTITVLSTTTNGNTCLMTLTRNWQISDCCSNTAFCSQIVTV